MPLFIKHDFYRNFSNSLQSDNKKLGRSIMEDETAKLIVFAKRELVDKLISKGFKIKKHISFENLSNFIFQNKDNQDIQNIITDLIIKKNAQEKLEVINSTKEYNASGRYTPKNVPQLKMQNDNFKKSVRETFLNANADNVNNLITQHNINKMAIDKTNPEYKKALFKTATISVLSTIVVMGVAYGIHTIYAKHKKSKSKVSEQPANTEVKPQTTGTPDKLPMNANDLTENNYAKGV